MSRVQVTPASIALLLVALTIAKTSHAVDFAAPVTYQVGLSPAGVVVGDFNGDGKLDLAVANSGSGNVSVLLGNGDGTFHAAVNFDAGAGPQGIALGDFNGDHKLDLAVLLLGDAKNGPGFSVLLGNGDGTFHVPQFVPIDSMAAAMAVADFDLDKKSDIALSIINLNQQIVSILLFVSNGDGTFQSPKNLTLPIGGGGSLAVGYFNRDGRPDLVMDGPEGYNILLGQGDGTFQSPLVVRVADTFSGAGVQVVDINHDGVPDLITNSEHSSHSLDPEGARSSSTHLSIFLGRGDGTFQAEQILAMSSWSKSNVFAPPTGDAISPPIIGDFNGDRILDLFFLRTTFSGISHTTSANMRPGEGDGTFSESSPINIAFSPSSGADLNGDGLYDLLSFQGDAVAISLNTSPIMHSLTVTFTGDGSGSVTSNPAGISCESSGGDCATGQILPGTVYALTAIPAGLSSFGGWSGACTGTGPSECTVTLNSNQNVTATFDLPPDFTLTPTATNLSLNVGGQTSDTLTFQAQGGFSGTIALTCFITGSAPMPTCAVSPSSVKPGDTATLTIDARSLSVALSSPADFESAGGLYAVGVPFSLLAGALLAFSDGQRRRKLALCVVLAALAALPAACGGGSSDPPHSVPKTYTVTVTAASGKLQHSTTISVTTVEKP